MPTFVSAAIGACAILLASAPAHAQDAGQVGITFGAPTAIGLAWQATDTMALRPDFSFSTTSTNNPGPASVGLSGPSIESVRSTTFGVGVSGLVSVKHWDSLRVYVAPRFSYSRSSISSGSALVGPSHADTYTTSASLGARYMLGRRFAVFGETGLGFGAGSNTSSFTGTSATLTSSGVPTLVTTITTTRSTTRTWGTRGSVGIELYLR